MARATIPHTQLIIPGQHKSELALHISFSRGSIWDSDGLAIESHLYILPTIKRHDVVRIMLAYIKYHAILVRISTHPCALQPLTGAIIRRSSCDVGRFRNIYPMVSSRAAEMYPTQYDGPMICLRPYCDRSDTRLNSQVYLLTLDLELSSEDMQPYATHGYQCHTPFVQWVQSSRSCRSLP